VLERVRMPSLGGATGWLNSEPLGPAELRGHVVLVNFWTLTCINWLRQEPYVRAWSQAYRDDGLVVIGAHTPEFSFEHELDRVRQAIKERAIDFPRGRRRGIRVHFRLGRRGGNARSGLDLASRVADNVRGDNVAPYTCPRPRSAARSG
jgi:hypothetical protein